MLWHLLGPYLYHLLSSYVTLHHLLPTLSTSSKAHLSRSHTHLKLSQPLIRFSEPLLGLTEASLSNFQHSLNFSVPLSVKISKVIITIIYFATRHIRPSVSPYVTPTKARLSGPNLTYLA